MGNVGKIRPIVIARPQAEATPDSSNNTGLPPLSRNDIVKGPDQNWKPQTKFGATPPVVAISDIAPLALRLETMAKKESPDLKNVLKTSPPELLARALLQIRNDARVTQILCTLGDPEKISLIFYWMDIWDTSVKNDSNRRDAVEQLMGAPILATNSADMERIPTLTTLVLKKLADHVDHYGWSRMKFFQRRYNGIEVKGVLASINPLGEERPQVIIFRSSESMNETWSPFTPPESKEADHHLQAHRQFPEDPTGEDMAFEELEGNISEIRKTELFARREFPYNPRGRELAVGERAGNLSPEDKEELRKLRQTTLEARSDHNFRSFGKNRPGFDIPR